MAKQSPNSNSSSEVTPLSPQLPSPSEDESKDAHKTGRKRTLSPRRKLPPQGEEALALPGVPQAGPSIQLPSYHRLSRIDREYSGQLRLASSLTKDSPSVALVPLPSQILLHTKQGSSNLAQDLKESAVDVKPEPSGKKLSFLDQPPGHHAVHSSRISSSAVELGHKKAAGKKMSAAHRLSLTGEAPIDKVLSSTAADSNMFVHHQSSLSEEQHLHSKRHSGNLSPSKPLSDASSVHRISPASAKSSPGSNVWMPDKHEMAYETADLPSSRMKSQEQHSDKLVELETSEERLTHEVLRRTVSGFDRKISSAIGPPFRKERNLSGSIMSSDSSTRRGSSRTPDNLVLIDFDPSNRKKPVGHPVTVYSGMNAKSLVDLTTSQGGRSRLNSIDDVRNVIASGVDATKQKLGHTKRKIILIAAVIALMSLAAGLSFALIKCLKS